MDYYNTMAGRLIRKDNEQEMSSAKWRKRNFKETRVLLMWEPMRIGLSEWMKFTPLSCFVKGT